MNGNVNGLLSKHHTHIICHLKCSIPLNVVTSIGSSAGKMKKQIGFYILGRNVNSLWGSFGSDMILMIIPSECSMTESQLKHKTFLSQTLSPNHSRYKYFSLFLFSSEATIFISRPLHIPSLGGEDNYNDRCVLSQPSSYHRGHHQQPKTADGR